LASPFIGGLREKLRFDAEGLGASRNEKARSGRGGQRLGSAQVAQQLASAVTATPATRTNTELERKLLERARAIARAFTDCFFGDGVADADVQVFGLLVEKDYHLMS